MAGFVGDFIILMAILIGFGSCGIRKLMNQNPDIKKATTNGIVGLIGRWFR